MPSSVGTRICVGEFAGPWHEPQRCCSNSAAPATSGVVSPVLPDSHCSYSVGDITWTLPTILECCVPQYSAQNRWYVPGLVASNQTELNRPGNTSCFVRNAGT